MFTRRDMTDTILVLATVCGSIALALIVSAIKIGAVQF